MVKVIFERSGGSAIPVQASRSELTWVARELSARGRPQAAARLLAAADRQARVRIVLSDYDIPMLVAAIAAARRSAGLGGEWGRLRDL